MGRGFAGVVEILDPTSIALSETGDDVGEMPVPPHDDRALEALLSGSTSAESGFDWLLSSGMWKRPPADRRRQ